MVRVRQSPSRGATDRIVLQRQECDVAAPEDALRIIDTADPAHPREVGNLTWSGDDRGFLDISGSLVALQGPRIEIIDVVARKFLFTSVECRQPALGIQGVRDFGSAYTLPVNRYTFHAVQGPSA